MKHGLSHSKTYRAWAGAKGRCFNHKNPAFRHYGGRGITMCDAWKNSFEAFYADMGPCPNHEYWGLDRINNDGNYEPRNCRWTTPMVQSNNRRKKVRRVWFNIGMNVEVRTYLQKLATQNGEKVHELIERICISHLEKMAAEKKVRK